jgi:F-type H+-transporting ATPase subunit a
MSQINFILSPLEQFQVIPCIPLNLGFIDLTITNVTILMALMFSLVFFFMHCLKDTDGTLKLFPNAWQSAIESVYSLILALVTDNIQSKEAQRFFPLVLTVFISILCINLTGLVPYSFTLTSHLIATFAISLSIFIGINIVCARKYGLKMFSLFLPPGTSLGLAFLLVPIEFISYMFKPISLSIRLFANMMAGHTLLKVIAGFAFALVTASGILFLVHLVPLLILIPLFGLELGVALIQSFVFSVLISIYLNDALNLH